MDIEILRAKIHRVKVTQSELNYVGSITIDEDLMEASGILENEVVQVLNGNNGERIMTYAITGERGTGTICLNGPAARSAQVGDVVIILAYTRMDIESARKWKPTVVFPDPETNRLVT